LGEIFFAKIGILFAIVMIRWVCIWKLVARKSSFHYVI